MSFPLKDYQHEGVAFLAARDVAILGDDAGLGKSAQLIRAADARGCLRLVVLCPAVGRASWRLQFEEWDEVVQRPVVVMPDKTLDRIPDGPLVLLVTYDWLANRERFVKFRKMLADTQPFDAAFLDEVHYLKNPSAKRTRAVYGHRLDMKNSVLSGIPVIWAASATLTPMNASEMYPHMRALFPDATAAMFGGQLPNLFDFTSRFCTQIETKFGWKITGNDAKTIPALRDAMRPSFLMRLKSDVLKELPPILTDVLPLEVAGKTKTPSVVSSALSALDDDTFLAHVTALAEADPAYSTARRELGAAKAAAFAPWLKDFFETNLDKKLIVFAHHRATIAALMQSALSLGIGVVSLHGGTTAEQAAAHVHFFQNDPDTHLFVGQIRAAGTSITLTAGSTVVLLEPDPSPLNNYQAISRAHRIGQKADVRALFAFAENDPIDRRMAQILRRRATDFEDLFGADLPGAIKSNA